jgi:hypothetical protein
MSQYFCNPCIKVIWIDGKLLPRSFGTEYPIFHIGKLDPIDIGAIHEYRLNSELVLISGGHIKLLRYVDSEHCPIHKLTPMRFDFLH